MNRRMLLGAALAFPYLATAARAQGMGAASTCLASRSDRCRRTF